MKKHFIQLYRSIGKDKLLTSVKVLGLSTGFMVFVAAMLFVQGQLAFDGIHTKKDRMYRLNLIGTFEEIATTELAKSHFSMEPMLRADHPEIEEVVRIFNANAGYAEFQGERSFFDRGIFVDSTFFKVFDFDLIYGSKERALSEPNSIIISETLSRALFGDKDPMGELLTMSYGSWLVAPPTPAEASRVTGVFREEDRSHLQFDVITSFSTWNVLHNVKWSGPVVHTYLLLEEGVTPEVLNTKLEGFYAKNHEPLKDMYQPVLQALDDVHLGSTGMGNDDMNWQKFDRKYISIFVSLALIVLLIATVNFIQLSVGQSASRIKSTAIRKLVGATNRDTLIQYYFETSVLCLLSVVIAITGLYLISPFLSNEVGVELSINEIMAFGTPKIILLAIALIILVVGFVPAIITRMVPVLSVLAGSYKSGGKALLPKILILVQLIMSFGLLGGGIVVYNQTSYLLSNNDAFEQEFVLQVPLSEQAKKVYENVRDDMKKLPGITAVTAASNQFGAIGGLDLKLKVDGVEKELILPTLMVDPSFLDFYDIELKKGQKFTEWGKNEFIINQAMADNFGWEEPIGQQIGFAYGQPGKVVAVVDNFNYNTLHEPVEPFCFWNTNYLRIMSVKVSTGDMQSVLNRLEEAWSAHVTDKTFSYTFLEDDMEKMYIAEVTTNKIVGYLTIVAIILSSLGIYALSYLIGQRKTREVSIHKVLGAPVGTLFKTYSKQFYLLMLLGLIISIPMVYMIMKGWLNNFAYQDGIPAIQLSLGLLAMIGISTLALSFNLLKLISINPVSALREK
ncbi:MAG: hypothetical protein HEP71_31085 [Roseivirga sp.]|nr:hypothetical protein [Roseivirga sp.]